jgi:hypothetical protein
MQSDAGPESTASAPVQVGSARRLTDAEVQFYHAHGYLKIPRLISREFTQRLLFAAQQLAERFQAAGRPAAGNLSDWSSVNKGLHKRAMWEDLPDPEPSDTLLWNFSHSPGLAAVCSQLLTAPGPVRFYRNQIAVKMPHGQQGIRTPWHQDQPYLAFDRTERPQVWLALHDLPADSGTLRFLDGSHRLGMLGRFLDDPGEDAKTRFPQVFASHATSPPLDLEAGDATVHHPLTVHSAPVNSSTGPRWAFIIQLVAADTRFTGSQPYTVRELEELRVGQLLDHPRFPVIPTEPAG